MGRFQSIKNIIVIASMVLPLFVFGQGYPRFELYQLVQGQDSGQFVTTGVDSNLDFNSVMRFRFQDSTLLIGSDTVITDAKILPILLATIDAGLGIEVNQVNGQIFIESLSIEDSIYNGSGSIIEKGTPLYASDTQGNYWDVAPARADDPSKMPVVIIAGEEIGIGETGLGLIKGHIKQVNTTGLADGSEVYVDASGGYTSTKPTAEGVIIQRLGTVIKGETTNGSGIINLGDEGFWNDYTSLTKLRDTLVLVRGSITTEIGDSLTNYASRTELQDTANNIRTSITSELSDSLINYPNRIELGDTALAIRNSIPIEIGDSLVNYATKVELGDTSTNIRLSIPIQIADSLVNYATKVELGDTALSIRNSIPIQIGDSLVNYASRTELADTASAIRGDILSPLLENIMYIGSASNTTTTIEATDSRVSNTIVKRDANGKFASNFIDVSNGWGNVGIGYEVLNNINNSVYFNTAVGHQAGLDLTSGERNNFFGWQSGYNITSGSYNTFYGNQSGNLASTGSNNTFIGHNSGFLVTTGSNNTFVGYNTEGDNTSSNSIAIGYDVEITGSNKIAIGNSSNTELKANNYVFNIDENITGKDGQVLTFNLSSGEIELAQTGDVTTSQLADTALAIRGDFPSLKTVVLSSTIRDLDSDSVLLMTIPTEYIGCEIIETAQSFYANNFTGASGVFLGSISGSTFTNNGNLISETISSAVGYHHLVRNTTSGVYVYPYTITGTSRFIRMNRPAATSGSAKAVTNTITIECNN